MNSHLAVAVEDLAAERAPGLVADEEHRALRPADGLRKWCLTRPAVHMPEVAMMIAGPLRLLIALDCSTVRTVERPGKLNTGSPASTCRIVAGSKQSRWRRKTSVTSAAIGLSKKTGTLGIRLRGAAAQDNRSAPAPARWRRSE